MASSFGGIAPPSHSPAAASSSGKERLQSLDAFRGLTLCIMIFVNYGGGGFWFFDHAAWDGLTLADFVFPWFIFMMGCSMALSMNSAGKVPKRTMLYRITKRALMLAGLGLFFNNFARYKTFRFPGVLQRFGFSYFFVALFMLLPRFRKRPSQSSQQQLPAPGIATGTGNVNGYTSLMSLYRSGPGGGAVVGVRTVGSGHGSQGVVVGSTHGEQTSDSAPFCERVGSALKYSAVVAWSLVQEIVDNLYQWIAALVFVMLWLALTLWLPVPGCPTGYLGPGGPLVEGGRFASSHLQCTGGAAGYIDSLVFTENHIYKFPTCQEAYLTGAFDPEGLLGCFTSIFLVFLGLVQGRIIVEQKNHRDRVARWVAWSVLLGFCGWAGLGFGTDVAGGPMPANKNLWSLTFVFLMGASGCIMLSIFYVIVDWVRLYSGKPFLFMGMNSIGMFLIHGMFEKYFPLTWMMYREPYHEMKLYMNVQAVIILNLVAYYFYRKDMFFKV